MKKMRIKHHDNKELRERVKKGKVKMRVDFYYDLYPEIWEEKRMKIMQSHK